MRPYPKSARRLSEAERIFNYSLSRSKNKVENAFGILANTWRIYQRPFECRVQLYDKLILATVVLHNYILELPTEIIPALGEEQTNPLVRMHVAAATNSTREALDVRNSFMEYFISDEGHVEWQGSSKSSELIKILVYTYFLDKYLPIKFRACILQ